MDHPLDQLRDAIAAAAAALSDGGAAGKARLERPPKPELGDYSTNAAMLLAPVLGSPPREVAERLGTSADRVEVAGPGFLNVFLAGPWYRSAVARMLGAAEPVSKVVRP